MRERDTRCVVRHDDRKRAAEVVYDDVYECRDGECAQEREEDKEVACNACNGGGEQREDQ